MSRNWAMALDSARRLVSEVENAAHPEHHTPGLIRCIADLCDAIEDVAVKSGLCRQDATEDAQSSPGQSSLELFRPE